MYHSMHHHQLPPLSHTPTRNYQWTNGWILWTLSDTNLLCRVLYNMLKFWHFVMYLPTKIETLDERVDDFSSTTILLRVISGISRWKIWTHPTLTPNLYIHYPLSWQSLLKMKNVSSSSSSIIWSEVQSSCRKGDADYVYRLGLTEMCKFNIYIYIQAYTSFYL